MKDVNMKGVVSRMVGLSFSAVWFRDHGTKEKTEGRAGGGADEDVGGDGGG